MTSEVPAFEAIVQSHPKATEIFYFRGLIWYNEGQFEKAKKNFQKSLELNPDFNKATALLSVVELREGKYQEAIQRLAEALRAEDKLLNGIEQVIFLWEKGLGLGNLYLSCALWKAGMKSLARTKFESIKLTDSDLKGILEILPKMMPKEMRQDKDIDKKIRSFVKRDFARSR